MDHWIFNLDVYWLMFIDGSGIFVVSALGIIGAVAKATPWAWDNWITPASSTIANVFRSKSTE